MHDEQKSARRRWRGSGRRGPAMKSSSSSSAQPPQASAEGRESVGVLIAEMAGDVSRLFRQEVEVARAELKEEAAKAGKAGGLLAGAGFAGCMVAVLVSLAAVLALAEVMPAGWAAVVVAVAWAIVGALLYGAGRRRLNTVSPVPRRTVETIKEDAQWLRNQTR